MSFSSEVKKEICTIELFDRELLKAELYGMLLFGRTFRENSIVFTTENQYVSKRITTLLENLYMPIIEKHTTLRTKTNENRLFKISVVGDDDCMRIFDDFGHSNSQVTLRVNRANISGDEPARAFVRGAF